MDQIKDYNVRQAWPIPEKMALLLIDMQVYFKAQAGPIIGNVISLINACKARGVKICFTCYSHRDPAKDGGILTKWWDDLINYGSSEWELLRKLTVTFLSIYMRLSRLIKGFPL